MNDYSETKTLPELLEYYKQMGQTHVSEILYQCKVIGYHYDGINVEDAKAIGIKPKNIELSATIRISHITFAWEELEKGLTKISFDGQVLLIKEDYSTIRDAMMLCNTGRFASYMISTINKTSLKNGGLSN